MFPKAWELDLRQDKRWFVYMFPSQGKFLMIFCVGLQERNVGEKKQQKTKKYCNFIKCLNNS